MERGWLSIPYLAWGAICLVVAAVWVFVWPAERAVGAEGLRFFLIRWGHGVVWALLATMCLLKASGNPAIAGLGNLVGLAALPFYLGFIAASYVWR